MGVSERSAARRGSFYWGSDGYWGSALPNDQQRGGWVRQGCGRGLVVWADYLQGTRRGAAEYCTRRVWRVGELFGGLV